MTWSWSSPQIILQHYLLCRDSHRPTLVVFYHVFVQRLPKFFLGAIADECEQEEFLPNIFFFLPFSYYWKLISSQFDVIFLVWVRCESCVCSVEIPQRENIVPSVKSVPTDRRFLTAKPRSRFGFVRFIPHNFPVSASSLWTSSSRRRLCHFVLSRFSLLEAFPVNVSYCDVAATRLLTEHDHSLVYESSAVWSLLLIVVALFFLFAENRHWKCQPKEVVLNRSRSPRIPLCLLSKRPGSITRIREYPSTNEVIPCTSVMVPS